MHFGALFCLDYIAKTFKNLRFSVESPGNAWYQYLLVFCPWDWLL